MCERETVNFNFVYTHNWNKEKKIYIYTWDREADSETVCIAVYDGQDEADISFGGLRPCVRKNITIISISPLCCSGNPNTKKKPWKKVEKLKQLLSQCGSNNPLLTDFTLGWCYEYKTQVYRAWAIWNRRYTCKHWLQKKIILCSWRINQSIGKCLQGIFCCSTTSGHLERNQARLSCHTSKNSQKLIDMDKSAWAWLSPKRQLRVASGQLTAKG